MNDFTKMFDNLMKQGQDMAGKMGVEMPNLDAFKTLMPDSMQSSMDDMLGTGIDPKTRALLSLAGLTAQGAEDTSQITVAVEAALAAGASNREISESIVQMATVGALTGVPKAMTVALSVMATKGTEK